jgi:stage III sporulation protein AD
VSGQYLSCEVDCAVETVILFIGLIGTVLIVLVREERPEIAVLLGMVVGIVMFLLVFGRLSAIIDVLTDLVEKANISEYYLAIVLKVIGIAYLTEFGSQIAEDANCKTVAAKIELGGKIIIMTVSIPILVAVLQAVLRLLPS